jgi:low affinity Fe/Cu permease
MPHRPLGAALTRLGVATAHPAAFLVFLAYVGLWGLTAPDQLGWHEVATIATWAMTLMIQRSEHRDTQALQAKLDELLRAVGAAESGLQHIDKEEPEDIEAEREQRAKARPPRREN